MKTATPYQSFARDYPELFQTYVGVLRLAHAVEDHLRTYYEKRYTGAIVASERLAAAASAAAHTEYRQRTQAAQDAHRQASQALRDGLNAEIAAANEVFQAAERIARVGVNEEFAALDQQLAAMQMAAVELRDHALAERATAEYQAARAALINRITTALAPARAVYDRSIADMHTKFQMDNLALDNEHRDFVAPYVATRTSQIDADKARHARVSSSAYMRRYHSTSALDHLLLSQSRERLAQIELFLQTSDRQAIELYFGNVRRALRDAVDVAKAEEDEESQQG